MDTFFRMDGSNNFHTRANTHIFANEKTAGSVPVTCETLIHDIR